jgi:hypothetical protein
MTKLLTAIAATLLALSTLATGAEAGCHHGGFGFFRAVRHIAFHSPRHTARRVVVVQRQAPVRVVERVVVQKEAAKPAQVTEEVAEVESENSSITASDEVADVKPPKKANQKVAAAGDLGCKSFFASVGMTLSVPCNQK